MIGLSVPESRFRQIGVLQDLSGFRRSHLIEKRHACPNGAFREELYRYQEGIIRRAGKTDFLQFLKNFLVDDVSPFFD
jgi:hypothetical protein